MIEAINVTKIYDKNFKALKDLNLKINSGEIYCLLGSNGAGKSTTINLFLDFIQPTSGNVLINGLDVSENSAMTKNYISYIPENLMLYPHLTGLENLKFFYGLNMETPKKTKDELVELLITSGLQNDFIHKKITTYSKGMRQKVGIALTKAKESKVLLLDEPTSGLDPKASNEFSDLLLDMKSRGVAILMATHDLFRAKKTGTHIGIMKEGLLIDSMNSDECNFKELEELYLEKMK